ncbi:MAG: hypothetical protein ACKOXB_07785 [Flavobacteriales bacterium]
MKTLKMTLVSFAILLGATAYAQDGRIAPFAPSNLVRISPLALLKSKVKFHYERSFSPHFSAGAVGSAFYGMYRGFRVEPFARCYFKATAPEGFYGQGRIHFSWAAASGEMMINSMSATTNVGFSEYGASFDVGYQAVFGKKDNFVFDSYIGYRYSSLSSLKDEMLTDGLDVAKQGFRTLHANAFDLGISFGYKF